MKISEEVLKCEKQILEMLNSEDDVDEEIILEHFDWETVEPTLIHILLSDYDKKAYELASRIVWDAILDDTIIKDDSIQIIMVIWRISYERIRCCSTH